MKTKQTTPAPDIVVISATRDISDRTAALDALYNEWSVRERVAAVLLLCATFGAAFFNEKYELLDIKTNVFVVFLLIFGTTVGLWLEVFRLRRRMKALTYLLLERERTRNEP